MARELACKILIDDAAPVGAAPEVQQTLERVEKLLGEIAKWQTAGNKILVGSVEASELLGISRNTLESLPDLPVVRVGTRRLYRVEALKAWAKAHESLPEVAN